MESGVAARTIAAYIDLNPVGAGMVEDPAELLESKDNETALKDLGLAKMLRCRVRYFTDDVVIGTREFVNEAFAGARERFGPQRKDGARKLRGGASAVAGILWSLRDLQKMSLRRDH